MTLRVIGFEGSRDDGSPVNWGTAAIADEDRILNAVTRQRSALDRLDELVEDGHLTRFKRPLQIDTKAAELPLVVVELVRASPLFPFLAADTGRIGGLTANRAGREHYVYIFDGQESMDLYAHEIASRIAQELLYRDWSGKRPLAAALVNAGLVLTSQHPALNALRVAWLPESRRDRARSLALACIESEADTEAFTDLLDALTAGDDETYVIKYEEGIAQGGGLDVDQGARILGGAKSAHAPLAKEVVRRHPYLSEPPPPRFNNMMAASATLHFTAHIEGRPLGEAVARRLELRMLERGVRGEALPVMPEEQRAKLEKAIDTLRRPDDETTVSHVPIGKTESEPLSGDIDKPRARVHRSEPLTMLGYQSGMINDADQVEIMVFPPVGNHHRGRLLLKTHDDGDGNEPIGVRPLQEGGDLLSHVMAVTILRIVDAHGRESTHLRKVKPLGVGGHVVVTAIPSSVVDGAVMYGLYLDVRRPSSNRIVCDLGAVKGTGQLTLRGAREWMEQYAARCQAYELAGHHNVPVRYWRPARPHAPSALHRLLVVLKAEGGAASQSHVVAQINERFGGNVRINNTRREVIHNPSLLAFDEEDRRIIRLLPDGEAVAAAFERAGGKTTRTRKR